MLGSHERNDVTYYYHIRPGSILTGGSTEKKGKAYAEIFNEILHNLTPDKERGELIGYQSTFCTVLAQYSRCVPELRTVFRFYKKSAKQYGCWSVYFTVSVVAFASLFGNPMGVLGKFDNLRWKWQNKHHH